MRKIFSVLAAMAVLLVAYIAAGPYLTVYHIKQALDKSDTVKLEKHINFPAVRQDVKQQIQQKLELELSKSANNNPMTQLLGNAFLNNMADKLLESYVTAEGIQQLMQGVDPAASTDQRKHTTHTSNSDAALSGARTYFHSHDTFLVDVKTNKQGDIMTLRLSRTGLTWQLTGIQMPW